MAGVKVWGITVLKSDVEKNIRNAFENYMVKLTEQKHRLTDDITDWSDALMRSIYKHASQQKYLLEQEYVAQMQNLNRSCRDFINELHFHEKKNDTERIEQLFEQCQALKFELSALETNGQTVPFIGAPNRENFAGTSVHEYDAIGNEEPSFDDASLKGNEQILTHSLSRSSPSNRSDNYTKQTR